MSFAPDTIRALTGPLIGLWLVLCLGLSAQEKPKTKLGSITDIRIESESQITKVIVVVNGLIDIKSDRIENPSRIFVDFIDTIPVLAGRPASSPRGAVQAIPAGDSLLKQVRIAENQKGITRLVFDLETAEVEHRTLVLKDPNRLLVELRPLRKSDQMRNPLQSAASPITAATPGFVLPAKSTGPKRFTAESATKKTSILTSFRLPDPPVLPGTFVLPKADPAQMPYRVSGFVLRDLRLRPPPTSAVGRQALRSQTPAVAASRLSAGEQSLTRVLGLKIGKVVIDPGHGGHDVGCTGAGGSVEKDVTLDIAKRLAALLEANLGSEVILTRSDDSYVSLEQRTVIANQSHADLFISIHANSSTLRTVTGLETYYLNFTSSPEALEVAARENASSERTVADLGNLIKKIALKDKIDESREFAGKVQSSLYAGSTKAGNRTNNRGVRKAPFIVLIGAEMPSVLTEIGFLSNPREEALLKKAEYRQKIAESLYRGVSQYSSTLSHFNVASAGATEGN